LTDADGVPEIVGAVLPAVPEPPGVLANPFTSTFDASLARQPQSSVPATTTGKMFRIVFSQSLVAGSSQTRLQPVGNLPAQQARTSALPFAEKGE
jgi:hypothetical protein